MAVSNNPTRDGGAYWRSTCRSMQSALGRRAPLRRATAPPPSPPSPASRRAPASPPRPTATKGPSPRPRGGLAQSQGGLRDHDQFQQERFHHLPLLSSAYPNSVNVRRRRRVSLGAGLSRIGLWLAIGMRLWSNPSGAREFRGQAVSALRCGTSLGAIVARRTDTLVQPEAQRL